MEVQRECEKEGKQKKNGGELENWEKGGEPMDIPREAKNMEGFLGEKNR